MNIAEIVGVIGAVVIPWLFVTLFRHAMNDGIRPAGDAPTDRREPRHLRQIPPDERWALDCPGGHRRYGLAERLADADEAKARAEAERELDAFLAG